MNNMKEKKKYEEPILDTIFMPSSNDVCSTSPQTPETPDEGY